MTSLVFFAYVGVDRSIIINGIILSVLAFIVLVVFYRREANKVMIYGTWAYIFALIFWLFSDISFSAPQSNIVHTQGTEYNDIVIYEKDNRRLFSMNWSNSSGLDMTTWKSYFWYIQDVTDIIDREQPKKILVIGAAGFTLPQDIAGRDYVEQVDVCDIDGSLDAIAQEHFLQEDLHEKIVFFKESARYFINKKIAQWEKYDFIFIDAYNGKISIPSELLTEEFFESVAQISRWPITMNVIMDAGWTSTFAKKLSNTLDRSLDTVYVQSKDNRWIVSGFDNFILSSSPITGYKPLITYPGLLSYTDNLNTLEHDKYRLFYTAQTN